MNASSCRAYVGNQFLVARTVEHHHHQVFHLAIQPAGNVLQVVGYGCIEIHSVLARRADNNFVHVAIGRVEQAAALRCCQHGNRPRCARRTQVGTLQRIDRNINFRNLGAIRKFGADFLADVEHGRLVALAFADHDGAAHGNGVHGLTHGLGGDLVAKLALALSHGAGRSDGSHFHHAQKSRRQVALDVFSKTAGFTFRTSLRRH
jgi:hypothetical protein